MEKQGMYVYGFLNSDKELFFGPHGISACEEVYTVSYQGISAVVSDSEIVDYTRMHKDSLAIFLVRHQRAIEKIMGLGYTIIPMRLGTFAKDRREIQYILSYGYSIIKDIFSKISDRIEIDIVAEWSDFTSTLKRIGEGEEIKLSKERLLASPGGATMDDRMKVGFMVKESLDKKGEGYSQEIQTVLKSVSQACKIHELMNDKMVSNIAFLIDKSNQNTFYEKVEKLNAKFKEELNFRCIGPLPPYSFYTVEIKTINNEEIDWAKNKLGILNDIISKDELKKAYHGQAFSTHPDNNPQAPGAEKEFTEVNRAHKILSDYCIALEQANPVRDEKSLNGTKQQDQIFFDREVFKEKVMLMRVRE